jgi:hypothetical protein
MAKRPNVCDEMRCERDATEAVDVMDAAKACVFRVGRPVAEVRHYDLCDEHYREFFPDLAAGREGTWPSESERKALALRVEAS